MHQTLTRVYHAHRVAYVHGHDAPDLPALTAHIVLRKVAQRQHTTSVYNSSVPNQHQAKTKSPIKKPLTYRAQACVQARTDSKVCTAGIQGHWHRPSAVREIPHRKRTTAARHSCVTDADQP